MPIRVDPDVMNQRASQYRAEGQNVGRIMSNMDNLMHSLQMEWEGEASKAYEERYFSELRPNMQKVQQLIDEIASSLDRTAAEMREQDAMLASNILR